MTDNEIRGLAAELLSAEFARAQVAEMSEWIDALVASTQGIGADIEAALYDQYRAAITGDASPVALRKAQQMATDAARIQADTLIRGLVQTELKSVAATIAQGMADGKHPYAIARQLEQVVGLDSNRQAQYLKYVAELERSSRTDAEVQSMAETFYRSLLKDRRETIAVTETATAQSEARSVEAHAREDKWKAWRATDDERVCDICRGNEEQGAIDVDEAFASGDSQSPAHPSCVLGDTRVIAPGILCGVQAFYEGDIVDIGLFDGRVISVTPNHMFLTPDGFAAAKSLIEADEILNCPITQGESSSINPDNNWQPPTIEQVITALSISPQMSSAVVPASPEYLHGDAAFCNGNVNIVAPNGFLLNDANPVTAQTFSKIIFNWDTSDGFHFSRFSDLHSMLFALRGATDGGVGIRREGVAFLRRHAREAQPVSIRTAANGDASLQQYPADHRPGYVKSFAEGQFGFTRRVSADNILDRHELVPPVSGDVVAPENIFNTGFGNSEHIRDILQSFSGLITTTRILFTRLRHFCGHVYDLQSDSSLYIVNGCVSSNCRCSVSYTKFEDIRDDMDEYAEQRKEEWDAQQLAEAAAAGASE